MKLWKNVLASAMTLCLIVPAAVYAAGDEPDPFENEAPSFTNPAQAQHAENIAVASFSEQDEARATNYADGVADKTATETATTRAGLASSTYAEQTATTFVEDTAKEYAEGLVVQKSEEYATGLGYTEGTREYQRAYDYAYTRATNPDYHNAYNTAYEYAYNRATNPDYPNAYDSAYKDAYDSVYQRYYDAAYGSAYGTAYEEAMADAVSRITGAKLEEINRLRYEENMGWGQIKHHFNGLPGVNMPNGVLGLGHTYRIRIDDPEELMVPPGPRAMHLDDEIAEATRRNTKTGWNDETDFGIKNNKNKNSKKQSGLTQTSGVSTSDVRGNMSNNPSAAKSTKSNNNRASSASATAGPATSNNDKAKGSSASNNSNNGNSGNSNNGNSGNSNNGNSDNSNNGNSGNSNNGNSDNSNNGNSDKSNNGNSDKSNNGKDNSNKGGNKNK